MEGSKLDLFEIILGNREHFIIDHVTRKFKETEN